MPGVGPESVPEPTHPALTRDHRGPPRCSYRGGPSSCAARVLAVVFRAGARHRLCCVGVYPAPQVASVCSGLRQESTGQLMVTPRPACVPEGSTPLCFTYGRIAANRVAGQVPHLDRGLLRRPRHFRHRTRHHRQRLGLPQVHSLAQRGGGPRRSAGVHPAPLSVGRWQGRTPQPHRGHRLGLRQQRRMHAGLARWAGALRPGRPFTGINGLRPIERITNATSQHTEEGGEAEPSLGLPAGQPAARGGGVLAIGFAGDVLGTSAACFRGDR